MEFTQPESILIISVGIAGVGTAIYVFALSPTPEKMMRAAYSRTFGRKAPSCTSENSRKELARIMVEYLTERKNVSKLSEILGSEERGDTTP